MASASVKNVAEGSRGAHRMTVFSICAVSLILCCGLAWWQWERFSSANGTFQNLGYVLQWPLFGLFPAFMFWRIRKLRKQQEQTEAEHAGKPGDQARLTQEIGKETAPLTPKIAVPPVDSEDAELAAYNRYLAQLNAQD